MSFNLHRMPSLTRGAPIAIAALLLAISARMLLPVGGAQGSQTVATGMSAPLADSKLLGSCQTHSKIAAHVDVAPRHTTVRGALIRVEPGSQWEVRAILRHRGLEAIRFATVTANSHGRAVHSFTFRRPGIGLTIDATAGAAHCYVTLSNE